MPKAILELEMPESCGQCPCSHFSYNIGICNVILHFCPEEGRHKYCPLKLVEGCEWVLIDDDKGLWQCSQGGAEWVLETGTPVDNEINYCPMCGRRLEVCK